MQWWRVSRATSVGRFGDARGGGVRVDWADTAKAVSIVLLVFWTLEGTSLHVNRMLNLARMPLFFFVSGLFAWRVVTRTDFGTFARDKVGNLVYLYLLWATLLFASTYFVAWAWWGREIDPRAQVALLWDPFVPMWFFYGLAIAFVVAWACRDLPVALVTAAALAAHVVAVATGDWLSIPVFEKVVRLFPWFWLGLVFRPAVFALVERHWRLWPLPLAAYLLLSYAFFDTSWNRVGPLTFAITGVGVAPLALVSAQLSRLPLVAGPLRSSGLDPLHLRDAARDDLLPRAGGALPRGALRAGDRPGAGGRRRRRHDLRPVGGGDGALRLAVPGALARPRGRRRAGKHGRGVRHAAGAALSRPPPPSPGAGGSRPRPRRGGRDSA